jgi:glycosyltransferase involved in cell wall biosynthesis
VRLLVVTQYFWPENFRINDLVADMVKRGHQVTVLTGLPNYPSGEIFSEYSNDSARFSNYHGAEIVRVPMMPRRRGGLRLVLNYLSFAISASLLGPWKLRKLKFDVILAYEPSPITVGLPAVLMRRIKKAPLVFWVLDLWPETLQAIGVVKSPFILRAVGQIVRYIYLRCDLILAQSRSFIPQIQKYAGKQSRIVYFPSWAESVFGRQVVEPALEIAYQANDFNIMFAGNIGYAQDFPSILSAAENLKTHSQIKWLIVGDGRMAQWVADEVKRRDLQDCVIMLGRYPVERMPSFYIHADALLVSLKDEPIFSMTIPGKLQSYLAAGIPVLAMLNGEGASVVERSNAGFSCAAGDVQALSDGVLKLVHMSSEERDVMGRNGVDVTLREFDRDTLIKQLEYWMVNLKCRNKSLSD